QDNFEGNTRVIDNEISLDSPIEYANDSEHWQNVVYSQILVSDEGIEHIETSLFQFSSAIDLMVLQDQGWQLIDSERNIPLMVNHYAEWCGAFTGVFVQKDNLVEFYPDVNTYSNFPSYSTDEKRMIDLELIPADGDVPFTVDETYLQY
ncbi:MAG TPA: hypothetical protein VLA12_18055, partial [Planctomycetaceae bacterium]|nr:hypothetical protein [Planctomycetaceae bacterium]